MSARIIRSPQIAAGVLLDPLMSARMSALTAKPPAVGVLVAIFDFPLLCVYSPATEICVLSGAIACALKQKARLLIPDKVPRTSRSKSGPSSTRRNPAVARMPVGGLLVEWRPMDKSLSFFKWPGPVPVACIIKLNVCTIPKGTMPKGTSRDHTP